MKRLLLLGAVTAAFAGAADTEWRFSFNGPLPRWKDGLPVGNGRLGAQVWGSGPEILLTLDRGDIWDLRYIPNQRPDYNYRRLRELVQAKDRARIQSEMNPDAGPLSNLTPTRISIGRMKLALPADAKVESAELDMREAEVRWQLRADGRRASLRVFAALEPNLIVATLEGVQAEARLEPLGTINRALVGKLGYPEPASASDGRFSWVVQRLPESGHVVTMWTALPGRGAWTLLLTIPPQDDPAPLETARYTLEQGAALGVERLAADHRAWWADRWSRSDVSIPDLGLKRLWRNGIYKLASSSWRGAPANLQGLWPPDGEIPPWRGDYHTNMNVQETYWPAYSGNHLDLAEPLNRWLFERVSPEAEMLTRRFFGVDGMWVGTALDVKGRLLGGTSNWMTVQYWLGAGAWLAQHAWWHYSFGGDREYLAGQAYPFLKRALLFYERILEEGPDGRLHVPLSSSPEFFSNELDAWTPDPTSDVSLIRNLIRYTVRASEILGVDEARRAEWRRMDERLAPYPRGSAGLKLQPNAEYFRSHRHPIHLFPIFPGEDLTVEGSDADRALINRSIREWIFRGTGEWTGWSYPYGSLIAARVRRGNHALALLDVYRRAYIWPNGFHVNGDYKRQGFSVYEYEPFTMEGECAFTAAVNEMLLQSWGGRVRIFPALPEEWRDVSFRDLRAEGGFLVSAEMRGGRVVSAEVKSQRGGEARVVWPSGERIVRLSPGERKTLVP